MIVVNLDKAQLSGSLNSPRGELGRYLVARAQELIAAARIQVGADTGKLRASIHIRKHSRSATGQYMEIGTTGVDYALVHHEGSRPHVIVRDTPMRFSSGGRVIYTHAVVHPGTRPNKYLSDNLNRFK
jgi:hypothetical protein